MTEAEFTKFRKLVYTGTHLFCPDVQKPLFERKIGLRLAALQIASFQEYYALLTETPEGTQEFTQLIEVLAVHETSFFRIAGHFAGLETRVFPEFFAPAKMPGASEVPGISKARPALRIWSAGCSTGEEPYSIAIAFLEAVSRLGRQPSEICPLEILATDFSPAAIAKAQSGSYSPTCVQKIPQPLLDKYFRYHDHHYDLTPQVKNFVQFQLFNLIHVATPPVFAVDVIFCRNLLIYFDRAAQQRLILGLTQALAEGGYLFLGDAESLHAFPEAIEQFHLIETGDAIFYQKHGAGVQ